MNLSALDAVYGDEQRGQPPYDPRMMTKVLVYGYCVGVFSSRRIERRLVEDVGFRVLAAGNAPNFRTIADFRYLQFFQASRVHIWWEIYDHLKMKEHKSYTPL